MKWLPYWLNCISFPRSRVGTHVFDALRHWLDCWLYVTWIQLTWPFRRPNRPTYFPDIPPMPGHEWPIPWARHIRHIALRSFMRAFHRPCTWFSRFDQLMIENMYENLFSITDPNWWLERELWLNEPRRIQLKLFLLASRNTW